MGDIRITQLVGSTFRVDSIVRSDDQVPSVLNGRLDKVNPFFGLVPRPHYNSWQLQLSGKSMEERFYVQESEIFNDRLVMLPYKNTPHMMRSHQTPICFNTLSNAVAHHSDLW